MNQENQKSADPKVEPEQGALILSDAEKGVIERFFSGQWDLSNAGEINRAREITPRIKAALCKDPRFGELMYCFLFNGAFGLKEMSPAVWECGKILMLKSDFMAPVGPGRPAKPAPKKAAAAQPQARPAPLKPAVVSSGYGVDEDDE